MMTFGRGVVLNGHGKVERLLYRINYHSDHKVKGTTRKQRLELPVLRPLINPLRRKKIFAIRFLLLSFATVVQADKIRVNLFAVIDIERDDHNLLHLCYRYARCITILQVRWRK